MMLRTKGRKLVLGCAACAWAAATLAAVLSTTGTPSAHGADGAKTTDDPALTRAREEVQKLDTLYKTAVVSVNQLYEGPPAAKVAKQVFAAMEKGGHHAAKLVDATGSPQNESNLPKTDFEKRAENQMQAGKTYYEEVVGTGDKRRLLAATVVPAVHKKCATCHGVKEGDLLGFIRYDVPVK